MQCFGRTIDGLRNPSVFPGWCIAGMFLVIGVHGESSIESYRPSDRLNLLVTEVVSAYPPYVDFCRRNTGECDLDGPHIVALDTKARDAVQRVNATVNIEIRFISDIEEYGSEEYWNYPSSGRGDCEDKALLKRKELFASGIPRGAMRLALVFHREFFSSHCVLTLETTDGTLILDSITNDVRIWHQTPYNFEARERIDGDWERFDQGVWSYRERKN